MYLKKIDFVTMSISFMALFLLFWLFSTDILFENRAKDASAWEETTDETGILQWEDEGDDKRYALLQGSAPSEELVQSITSSLNNMRKRYRIISSLEEMQDWEKEGIVTIVVTENLDEIGETLLFDTYAQEGMDFVFTCLPKEESCDQICMDFLGIQAWGGERKIEGYALMEGLYAEEPFFQKETSLVTTDVTLSGRCKVFMNEYDEKKEVKDRIPLMWRTFCENGEIFVMNHPFLREGCGMGLLAMTLAQFEEYYLYPVVNARILAVDYIPLLTDSFDESCLAEYSRTGEEMVRDVAWPGLISLSSQHDLPLTLLCRRGEGEKEKELEAYLAQASRYRFEIGWGGSAGNGLFLGGAGMRTMTLEAQTAAERAVWYPDAVIATDGEGEIPYRAEGGWMILPVTQELNHSGQEEYHRAVDAVMGGGYLACLADLSPTLSLERQEDEWVSFSKKVGDNLYATIGYTSWIEGMTASKAAERAARYLAIEPRLQKGENNFRLSCGQFEEEAFFLLISKREPVAGEGCEIRKLFGDVYLLTLKTSEVTVDFVHAR